jgi:hypothetical protein
MVMVHGNIASIYTKYQELMSKRVVQMTPITERALLD